MSAATRLPIAPELGPIEADSRSMLFFEHGFPSEMVRWHCHNEYELHLIVASVGKMFVGDHVGVFEPGQLVLTGPGLPHNWISQTKPAEIIERRDVVIQFRQNLVQSMANCAPELRALLPLLERAKYGVYFKGISLAEAESWFIRIRGATGTARIAILIEFLEFLSKVPEQSLLSTMPIQSKDDEISLNRIERAVGFMTDNYSREVLLSEVAALSDMSESAFSRMFAKATGNNFTLFLNRIRIAKACELLASTDEPITSICLQVGFNNVSNFNRRFRDIKMMTPREYRRLAKIRLSAPATDERSGML